MKTALFLLSVTVHLSFGLEVSRDSIESSWTGGEPIWLLNKSPDSVIIASINLKKVTGKLGDELIFKISNEKTKNMAGFKYTHWYRLQNSGDSLSIDPQSWSQNPIIRIPPSDSISMDSFLYGTCLFCASSSQQFNYHIKIMLSTATNDRAEFNLIGNFVSGGLVHRKTNLERTASRAGRSINGKRIGSGKSEKPSIQISF